MLVDYLRYVAFEGRLRSFFEEALYDYVEPSVTTGQHLRFAPDFLDEALGWRGQALVHDLYWQSHSKEVILERLKHDIGLAGGPDSLTAPRIDPGGRPKTFSYSELRPPKVEIIVDVDPSNWTPRYDERRRYEDIPVIYRRAGPAKADFNSGDKLFDRLRGPTSHGTLCGFFCSVSGPTYALTCGHVANNGARMRVEHRHRIWKLPLWSTSKNLGTTRYAAMSNPATPRGPISTQLDAALIEVQAAAIGAASAKVIRQATVKPISTILQEEPVRFRGSGRAMDTMARVSAITVRKSIDLHRDGVLRDVGDVLMLGHRHPMYIAQRVSRRGDSGAAVRQDFSSVGPFTELNQWHGMVLGSDDGGAYATYAEYLWAWAANVTSDSDIEFIFEV